MSEWTARDRFDFVGQGGSDLAQYLQNSGLLSRINEQVLHPVGLALAVDAKTDEISEEQDVGTVVGLTLLATDDPEGIVFDNEQRMRSRRRLIESGQLRPVAAPQGGLAIHIRDPLDGKEGD